MTTKATERLKFVGFIANTLVIGIIAFRIEFETNAFYFLVAVVAAFIAGHRLDATLYRYERAVILREVRRRMIAAASKQEPIGTGTAGTGAVILGDGEERYEH